MTSALALSTKHSAAGPYLGFALQPVRLCYYLLCSPDDATVSLEHLDDVAVHYSDGTVVVEQCKSALSHNALSDWSGDFWKAIANWLDAIRAQQIAVDKAAFTLYVTPVWAGSLATAMHTAATPQEVLKFTESVRAKLAKKAEPPKCMVHVQRFLDATDDERLAFVQRMSVVSTDVDPLDSLRALFVAAVPASSIDIICEAAIGMAKERADRCIRRGVPAIIGVAEFRKDFHAFVQRNNLVGYLPSFSITPTEDEAKEILMGKPVFVRQLQLVEASQEQQIRAISDFMRTSSDKAKWADQGLVFEGSLKEWEDSLLRRHAAIQGEINDLHGDNTELIRGRTIYNRCSTLEVQIDSRAVPGHFTHGGFNDLADRQELGWHPQFKKLLGESGEE